MEGKGASLCGKEKEKKKIEERCSSSTKIEEKKHIEDIQHAYMMTVNL